MRDTTVPDWRDIINAAIRDRWLYVILAFFVLLATTWNFTTPIFEAPDEPDHLQYILFVADKGRRPDLQTDVQHAGIESPQPPLYYFSMAAVLRFSGTPRPFDHPLPNPEFDFLQMDSAPNYFIPFAGDYRYVHLLRGLSTVFGIVTVLCTYLSTALLGVNRLLRLTATAATAFLPQFTFVSSAISNDPLTAAISSLALVWLIYLAQTQIRPAGYSFVFGVLCALAFLSKSHVLFLLPYGAVVLLTCQRQWREGLPNVVWMMAGFLLVAGPYLVYNQWRYGDFTAVNMQVLIVPELVFRKNLFDPAYLGYFTAILPRLLFQSFLGVFGWMRIYLPAMFYLIFGMLWLIALLGIAVALLYKRWSRLHETLILAPVFAFLVIVYVNITFTAPQGRYFFPLLTILSPLLVIGLAELPSPLNRILVFATPSFLLLTNLFSLWLMRNTFWT